MLKRSLEIEKANVIECHSKLGKQTARIDQLQREIELHRKGEQSVLKEVG